MTREETKKCIEVMQAHVDGKIIEFKKKEDEKWQASTNCGLSWYLQEFEYRIKEEPKLTPHELYEMYGKMDVNEKIAWFGKVEKND